MSTTPAINDILYIIPSVILGPATMYAFSRYSHVSVDTMRRSVASGRNGSNRISDCDHARWCSPLIVSSNGGSVLQPSMNLSHSHMNRADTKQNPRGLSTMCDGVSRHLKHRSCCRLFRISTFLSSPLWYTIGSHAWLMRDTWYCSAGSLSSPPSYSTALVTLYSFSFSLSYPIDALLAEYFSCVAFEKNLVQRVKSCMPVTHYMDPK